LVIVMAQSTSSVSAAAVLLGVGGVIGGGLVYRTPAAEPSITPQLARATPAAARPAAAADEREYSVAKLPPVVVRTSPPSGDTAVDAKATTEIRVTFSKDMLDKSWSWSQVSDDTFPKDAGEVHYDKDKRTCVMPVKLEPGKTYVLWLNTEKFHNFKDADGNPAVPYLLVFETKP
jgi:RNA polymerase sigma-70 factor (ECF subfamily)